MEKIDATDQKILDLMRKNARISMRELGAEISMSNTATAERVKKLEDAGVITGYTTRLNARQLGYMLHAFVIIEFTYGVRGHPEKFLQYLKERENIVAAYPALTGGMDYVMEIYCRDIAHFEQMQLEFVEFGFTTSYLVSEDMRPQI